MRGRLRCGRAGPDARDRIPQAAVLTEVAKIAAAFSGARGARPWGEAPVRQSRLRRAGCRRRGLLAIADAVPMKGDVQVLAKPTWMAHMTPADVRGLAPDWPFCVAQQTSLATPKNKEVSHESHRSASRVSPGVRKKPNQSPAMCPDSFGNSRRGSRSLIAGPKPGSDACGRHNGTSGLFAAANTAAAMRPTAPAPARDRRGRCASHVAGLPVPARSNCRADATASA